MKIHLLSDLHIDVCPFNPPETDADVLVLAGDIASDPAILTRWVLVASGGRPVILVPGNHEYYGGHLSKRSIDLRERASAVPSFHVLDNDAVVIDGIRFVGCTLWTDFELFGQSWRSKALRAAQARIADFRTIYYGSMGYFLPAQSVLLHRKSRRWLKIKLGEPFLGPTVVVTHHAPHRGSLSQRYAKDLLSAAFVSNLDELLGVPDLWLHGHTHDSVDYFVKGTRVVCNPRGYCQPDHFGVRQPGAPTDIPIRCENPNFNPGLVLEI